MSILYTILKFIVNLDFFFFVILLPIDGFFVLFRHFVYFSYFQTFYLQSLLPAVPSECRAAQEKRTSYLSPGILLSGNIRGSFSFFVLYSAFFFSFGIIIFSTIAATAAGTIPEPPKISWI